MGPAGGGARRIHPRADPKAVPFLSTFAAQRHLLRGAGLRGEAAQAPLQQAPPLVTEGVGSPACTWPRVVSLCVLCCCRSFRPPRLVIPSLHVLRKQNTSPQGSNLSIQWLPVLRHTFGRRLKGSWACISWAGTLRRSCPGSVRPRGRSSLLLHPASPPSLWSLPFLIYKDIQWHARASR